MQQGEYSCVANFSRLFNEILVRYENFFSYLPKKPEFVCKAKHPPSLQMGMIYRLAELLVGQSTQTREIHNVLL